MAYDVLIKLRYEGAYLHIVLPQAISDSTLSQVDKGLAAELAYGVTRNRGALDFVINQLSDGKVDRLSPGIREILEIAAYQVLYLDRIPAYAAVNAAVDMAKRIQPQASGFVNAVLRSLIREEKKLPWPQFKREPTTHMSVKHSMPEWIVRMWSKDFGVDTAHDLCKAAARPARATIRVNTLENPVDDFVAAAEALIDEGNLEKGGIEISPLAPEGLILPPGLAHRFATEDSRFTHQSIPSMVAPHVLDPQPGENVIDLCAAPGGKTTHIAALMKNQGTLLAVDKSISRLGLVEERAERLGVTCLETIASPGEDLPARYEGWADRLLLDAPCTGLGTISRRPDLRWQKDKDDIPGLVELQKTLLSAAVRYLKPGGVLVYSTCTISRAENEDIAEWASAGGELVAEGDWTTIHTLHGHLDGFFIARFQKK